MEYGSIARCCYGQFLPGQSEQFAVAVLGVTNALTISRAFAVTVSAKHKLPGLVELADDGK